jgi:pilus assembly protein Flp/PilA
MNAFSEKVVRFLQDEDGPTTVEYAMMILLVFLAVLTAITALGQATAGSLDASADSIEKAFGSAR